LSERGYNIDSLPRALYEKVPVDELGTPDGALSEGESAEGAASEEAGSSEGVVGDIWNFIVDAGSDGAAFS
jgi:hypothetical protein